MAKSCFNCGRPAHHEHHPIPKSMGGDKTIPLCNECHAMVHGMNDGTWNNHDHLTHKGLMKNSDGLRFQYAALWLHYYGLSDSIREIKKLGVSDPYKKLKYINWLLKNDPGYLRSILQELQDSEHFEGQDIMKYWRHEVEGHPICFEYSQGNLEF